MKPECMKDSWYRELEFIFKSSQYQHVFEFIKQEHKKYKICPNPKDVFKAFSYFDFSDTRVVMIFLSPYHRAHTDGTLYATGLATATPGITYERESLTLLRETLEIDYPDEFSILDSTLEGWANQGVLLFNPALTVRLDSEPKGHLDKWTKITKAIIQLISSRLSGVIFVPFGGKAREWCKGINRGNHIVLDNPSIPHPAAYSYAKKEYGVDNVPDHLDLRKSQVFKRINEAIVNINGEPINWYK